jgi:hypothetical protein
MKWGKQYRIYFDTVRNMPTELLQRLQNDDQNRITGSRFVEACFFVGFAPGSRYNQNMQLIREAIDEIFPNDSEQEAFERGMSL